jgi:hypothetical protein
LNYGVLAVTAQVLVRVTDVNTLDLQAAEHTQVNLLQQHLVAHIECVLQVFIDA